MYDELEKLLVGVLRLPEERIHPTATRGEAGLDSIGVVELAMAMEQHLGLRVSEDALLDADTMEDIAALMNSANNPNQPV